MKDQGIIKNRSFIEVYELIMSDLVEKHDPIIKDLKDF